jgi:hypothetical protein
MTSRFMFSLLVPFCCHAGTILLNINGGGSATVPLADAVGGWEFNITRPIIVTALGLWDEMSEPLSISHEVGLWNSDGSLLLSSTTVDNTSTAVSPGSGLGRWLFTDISAITLDPGNYVLGAVWGDPIIGADPFRIGTSVTTSGGATYAGACEATLLPAPILVFPMCGGGTNSNASFFGPNLTYTEAPEPAAAVLAVAGLLLLAVRRYWGAYATRAATRPKIASAAQTSGNQSPWRV